MSYQTQTTERRNDNEQTYLVADLMGGIRREGSGRRSRDYSDLPNFEMPDDWSGDAVFAPVDKTWIPFTDSYDNESIVEIDGCYDTTATRQYHDTNGEALKAWLGFEFPVHAMDSKGRALIRGSTARGEQFADGSGEFRTGGDEPLLAVRTRSGLLLRNEENSGRSWYRMQEDDELPLSSIAQLLSGGRRLSRTADLRGITRIHHGTKQSLRVLELEDGSGAAVARDPTMRSMYQHRNYGGGWRAGPIPTGWFGFEVTAEELASFRTANDALDLLLPPEVSERLATGDYTLVEGAPSQYQVNPPKYSWRRRTENIIRQGEWFFIPTESDFEPEGVITKPLNGGVLTDSLEGVTRIDPHYGVPAERVIPIEALGTPMLKDVETGELFTTERTIKSGYVADLAEFGGVPLNPRDVMGNHVPRDFVAVNKTEWYVRGTVRHVEGDHDVYNLRENWFRAVRHDREVMSFTFQSPIRGD